MNDKKMSDLGRGHVDVCGAQRPCLHLSHERKRIFIEFMTSGRELKASREGSK